ncbi:MAG: hypothetical protein OEX02_09220 [Cyclobacteriaceae bacterium]|nr:hypothetical protein [Cyclobacteriaceae bacterium]
MVNESNLKRDLRKRFREYLKDLSKIKYKKVLYDLFFEKLKPLNLDIYLFGGFPKDIYLKGQMAIPRDIDMVVVESDLSVLLETLKDYPIEKSRFGGYKVKYEGLDVDFWSIEKTWAFETNLVELTGINSLSETTFLNIEGIAVELFPKGNSRNIISDGFEGFFRENLLELNLEQNPFPALNIARSLYAAKKTDKNFGPRLLKFISDNLRDCNVEDVLVIYKRKYGLLDKEKAFYKRYFSYLKNNEFDRLNISELHGAYVKQQMKLFSKDDGFAEAR